MQAACVPSRTDRPAQRCRRRSRVCSSDSTSPDIDGKFQLENSPSRFHAGAPRVDARRPRVVRTSSSLAPSCAARDVFQLESSPAGRRLVVCGPSVRWHLDDNTLERAGQCDHLPKGPCPEISNWKYGRVMSLHDDGSCLRPQGVTSPHLTLGHSGIVVRTTAKGSTSWRSSSGFSQSSSSSPVSGR